MSETEKLHIIDAYAFELGKCYEPAIRERQLQCLANIDGELCAAVAAELGMPAPAPSVPLAEVVASPALSQLGATWPTDGRQVGIVVDFDALDPDVPAVRAAIAAAGMTPLLIAGHGGEVDGIPVQRTFATARSVEFDALLVCGSAAAADPRFIQLVDECWWQAKAIGAWGTGVEALARAGHPDGVGIVTGDGADDVLGPVQELMASHRAWERFPAHVSGA